MYTLQVDQSIPENVKLVGRKCCIMTNTLAYLKKKKMFSNLDTAATYLVSLLLQINNINSLHLEQKMFKRGQKER